MKELDLKIDHILNNPGLKILLLDSRTTSIAALIPQSTFLENKFFLFDNITNHKRNEFEIHCVLILSLDYLKHLIQEITSPKYLTYTIYFVNKIDEKLLKDIAEKDVFGKIINIFELNYNLIKEDTNLFITKEKDLYKKAECLQSLLETLEISPGIILPPAYKETELSLIANSIKQTGFTKKGTLLLLNRDIDMISPLLYPWRYQELIKQYFNFNNQLIVNGNKSATLDDFFKLNKFEDIFQVSQNLKTELKKVQTGKNVFDKKSLEFHFNLVNTIIKQSFNNSKLSEIEIKVIKKKENKELNEIKNIQQIGKLEELKLELIYFYRTGQINNLEYQGIIKNFVKQFPMQKLSNTFSKYISFKNNVDLKLSFRGRINNILKAFLSGILSKKFEVRNLSSFIYPLIVYMNGPLSYGEYFQICNLFIEKGLSLEEVYVVCEEIWTYEDFLKSYV
ncbi:Vacuolar protein sorting-associated protein 45 [Cucumispora dikerogammari]|nr:Vacuolar protein sorting-associated protein 45 [Cucumispora dikerogammari]